MLFQCSDEVTIHLTESKDTSSMAAFFQHSTKVLLHLNNSSVTIVSAPTQIRLARDSSSTALLKEHFNSPLLVMRTCINE